MNGRLFDCALACVAGFERERVGNKGARQRAREEGEGDGFIFFSSKGLGISQFTSILLTEARICLYNPRMYGHAPLQMGIYNDYSGYYKVRRRLYINEPFDKLNRSGKNGPDKIWRLNMLGVMLRNMT